MAEEEKSLELKDFISPFTTTKAILWIIAVGFCVYANSLFNGFVLDDLFQIVNNENIKGNILYFFSNEIGPYYRPLMLTTFSLFYKIFGVNPFVFHFWQVSLHILNAVLVFYFLGSFLQNKKISFFLALLFLVHPINTEVVNYASLLQDVYFILFGMLSLIVIRLGFGRNKVLILSSLLLFLSLLSKETGVLFIVIQLVYIFLYIKKNQIKYYYATLIPALIYFCTKIVLFGHIFNASNFLFTIENTVVSAPLQERLLNMPNVILYYFKTFFYPLQLAVSQLWWEQSLSFNSFFFPLIMLVLISAFIIFMGLVVKKKSTEDYKLYIFFTIWLLIGLAFHSQILPLDKTVADRWFYFPMVGMLGIIGIVARQFIVVDKKNKLFIFLICVLVISFLSVRTIVRNSNWHDPLTLYAHDISTSKNSAELEYNLGLAHADNGNYPEAIRYISSALKSVPNGYLLWQNLGAVYLRVGDYKKAEESFYNAIKIETDFYGAHIDLVNTYLANDRAESARDFLEDVVIKKWPDDSYAWRLLGYSNYLLDDTESAKESFKRAYEINPSEINSYYYNNLLQDKGIDTFLLDPN